MNMPIRFLLALLLFISMPGGVLAAPENNPPSPVLEELIGAALAGNPELKAAEARLHLYENKIIPAGSLNDPSLSFSLSNYPVDTFAGNEYAMSGKVVKFSQDLPFPGKLAARTEVAELQAKWYQALLAEQQLQLTRQVKDAYYFLVYAGRAVVITEKNMKLLDDFIRLTETSYEVGRGQQQDVLKAQVERAKLLDRLYSLRQQRVTALAAFNRLVNRPSATAVAEMSDPAPAAIETPLAELQKNSETLRPMYAAYRSLIDRYQAQYKLAQLDYQPDFKVGLAYAFREPNMADSGTDFAGIEVAVNLPIFRDKRSAAVAEAEEGVRMALAQYDDFRNQVLFNIQDAYSQVQTSYDQASLYKNGIIPQAGQALESAINGYQVGKLTFLGLLDNLMTLYNFELQYQKAVSDGQRNLARLEAESGQSNTPAQNNVGQMP
ncbi:MAG: TolC family protein [Proteobacteria bacterium]|nr:TolC family protein [Pseudomonadota bacterium]MBU1649657.1 TolC family protein [Pseudomonadota bacterium]